MSGLRMPERLPIDGEIHVSRDERDRIVVACTTDGERTAVVLSEYNAWRAFGVLSLMLGIPLPKRTARAIKLGLVSGVIAPKIETLGDRVAANLARAMADGTALRATDPDSEALRRRPDQEPR